MGTPSPANTCKVFDPGAEVSTDTAHRTKMYPGIVLRKTTYRHQIVVGQGFFCCCCSKNSGYLRNLRKIVTTLMSKRITASEKTFCHIFSFHFVIVPSG